MSNQKDHRVSNNERNKRREEIPHAFGCSGEGHTGQKGRSKWKKLSRRSERRAAGTRVPKVKKFKTKAIPIQKPDTMAFGEVVPAVKPWHRRKIPRPNVEPPEYE